MRFASLFAALLSLLPACAGAGGQTPGARDPLSQVKITSVDLPAERIGFEVELLLRESEAAEARMNRLASVTRALLARAQRYFDSGQEEAGLQATMGALYLVRYWEHRPELFAGSAEALLFAAARVARLGDEGRALAFYELARAQLGPGEARAEVDRHLQALRSWQTSSYGAGSMQAAGARYNAISSEALVSCTDGRLKQATHSSTEWLNRAIVLARGSDGPPRTFFEHDEAQEARRAVRSVALGTSALYLRCGDVSGALLALEPEPIASAAGERLVVVLEAAANGEAAAWAELFGLYEAQGKAESGTLSPELARGGAFGAALELYRVEPDSLRAAMPLAMLLVEHGMADAVPVVLSRVVNREADPRELAWALSTTFGALTRAEAVGDLELARRVFANAAPLLALPQGALGPGAEAPSVADFHYAMGALEARASYLERARPLLETAAKLAPSRDALRLLAVIDRQRGDIAGALNSVQGLNALAQQAGDVSGQARAALMAFELHRDARQSKEADEALRSALVFAKETKARARTGSEIASAETILAEVLEQYGELSSAARASTRAYEASQHDLGRLTATLLDASRRALTHDDLVTGRQTLRRALDARLDDEGLIYVALWTKLLQRRLGATSDGAVEEALTRIKTSASWTGALRGWARGELSDAQLRARARDPVQVTEAEFYSAMGSFTAAGVSAAVDPLVPLAKSSAVELVEVRIAQDIVARASGEPLPPLPAGIELP